jgi:thiosulfate dehydrogenase [quinone] large subunit
LIFKIKGLILKGEKDIQISHNNIPFVIIFSTLAFANTMFTTNKQVYVQCNIKKSNRRKKMKILNNKYVSVIWTILRVWLGWQWLYAGFEKITDPKGIWVGGAAGTALTGFLKGALAKAAGAHPSVQNWYASFIRDVALPNAKVFSYIVSFGEVLVGISLILGLFTVVGLLAGGFMNLNYMLAGTTSTNPILYTVTFILLVAGAAAYVIGLDRFALPFIKKIFNKKAHNSSIKT